MLKGSRQAILKRIQPISIHGQASWEIVFTHIDDTTEQLNAARVGPEAIAAESLEAGDRIDVEYLFNQVIKVTRIPSALVPPEPSQRIGQNRADVGVAVESLPLLESVVVSGERQRARERLVREPPAAMLVVQVVRAVLHEDADRLPGRLPYHRRVIVPAFAQRLARLDIREAADSGQDLAELVRTLPGDRERRDRPAALAGDGSPCGIAAKSDRFFHLGKDLFEKKARVLIGERVVLEAAVVARRFDAARFDEDVRR